MKLDKSVALHTLGCKLNFAETATLSRQFIKENFIKKNFNENADVYVINTCSVTENADKECKQLIKQAKKKNPNATIVITGCYAQLKPNEIAKIAGVDMVVGSNDKFNLINHVLDYKKNETAAIYNCDINAVTDFHTSYSLNDRTRTFLKIQDGCDYNCSFCTIPLARGQSRSDTIIGVIDNLKELSKNNIKEVVLTGVNIGDFGKKTIRNNENEENFFQLLQTIDRLQLIPRIRISSIEPNLLSDEIITLVASSKTIMPHFHIPLQSGNDKILSKMRRRYKSALYKEKVNKIKSLIPHCCIGVDVIVGFPGETDELFQETYDFINSLDISYLHVFTYSERENTLAASMEMSVPLLVRKKRNAILRDLSEKKMQEFINKNKGQFRAVLFESSNKDGDIDGFTDNYIKVTLPFEANKINKIVMVEVK